MLLRREIQFQICLVAGAEEYAMWTAIVDL